MLKKQTNAVEGRWKLAEGWSWRALGEVAEVLVGYKQAKENLQSPEGTIPLIVSGDLQNRPAIDISRYVTEEEYQNIVTDGGKKKRKDRKQRPERKLLIAAAWDTAGRIGILEAEQALFNSVVFAIIPKQNIQLEYLYYYFLMEGTRHYLQSTFLPGPRSYTNSKNFQQRMPIPLPNWGKEDTLPIQERIVERIEILTQTARQGRAQLREQRIDLLNSFTSTLDQLFSSGHAANWPHLPLHELITLTEAPEEKQIMPKELEMSFVEPEKIISCIGAHTTYQDTSQVTFTQRTPPYLLQKRGATLLYVLLQPATKRATLLDQVSVLCSPEIVGLHIQNREKLLPSFLLYALLGSAFTQFMLNTSVGAIVSRGQARLIGNYELPLPSIDEQQYIIHHLDEVQRLTNRGQALLEQNAQRLGSAENEILEHAFRGDL